MKAIDVTNRVFQCDYCGRTRIQEKALSAHEQLHRLVDLVVGVEVRWTTKEGSWDHGKPYNYGTDHAGVVVETDVADLRLLASLENDERRWVSATAIQRYLERQAAAAHQAAQLLVHRDNYGAGTSAS